MLFRSAASKSTLFVDGLGCRENAVCDKTEVERDGDLLGIRIDGSSIYLKQWKLAAGDVRRGADLVPDFIGRLLLMVENRYWLIIDTAPGHTIESRFHTYADCTSGIDWLSLKSGKEQMMMTFASLGKGVMQESLGMPTTPQKQTRIFRWISPAAEENNPEENNLHVTAMNPGSEEFGLRLSKETDGGYAIEVDGENGYQRTIRITRELKLKR